jgi:hypothetical protein
MVALSSDVAVRRGPSQNLSSRKALLIGYSIAATVVAAGWLANGSGSLVDPGGGVGYWLGITGASMMALLLLYPVRKRLKFMRFLGSTRGWFRIHMFLGVLGPVLILYHCNFSLGSLNSNVALVCTLLVALSGLVGRYLYTKIYQDLDGHKTSLVELTKRARLRAADGSQTAILVPHLLERMAALDELVLRPPETLLATVLRPMRLAVRMRWETIRLTFYASRQLRQLARKSPAVAAERKRLKRTTVRFIRDHQRRVRRVAEFASYERLFSLWHVFHLPFFYMLVLTALLHVVAVHMY